jgi:predicted Zn-dependent peptidase
MAQIKDLAENGPSAEEMQKIRNQLINDSVRARQSSMLRAQQITEFALYDGEPEIINSELDELLAISGEQIRDAVAKYLNTENRALLDVVTVEK